LENNESMEFHVYKAIYKGASILRSEIEARKDKCTCDDLGLSVAMDFAKDNGLPFQWKTETRTFDAASDEYSDYDSFSNDVILNPI
jgi:hypothetical protein